MRRFAFLAAAVLTANAANAQTYEIFHAFSGAIGEPEAGLILAGDGRLLGTTKTGGVFGRGSVYALTPDGDGYDHAELHAFAGADGAHPTAPLVQASDGFFYGTTSDGGTADFGTVFAMDPSGHVTTLHSFTGLLDDGSTPIGGLIQAPDGYLYGTTSEGGQSGVGTVFRISTAGELVTLHSFVHPEGGSRPFAALLRASDGNFYGTAMEGGEFGAGVVFRIDSAGNYAIVASFDFTNGAYPEAGLVRASNGYFYGLSSFAGLYRVGYLGGLVAIPAPIQGETRSTLIQASDGKLYGTSNTGFGGFVFRIDPSGSDFENVAAVGAQPRGSLLELPDGRLAGTITGGQVYAVDAFGNVDVLQELRSDEGSGPWGGLVQGSDGDLYGTTAGGGAFGGWGTVYRISLAGDLDTLHSFKGSDGFAPTVSLLESGGFFYGTTGYEFSIGAGNLFKVDAAGDFTVIHDLSGLDGSDPSAPLAAGPDGALYATTASNGENGFGTAYRIDADDVFETIHAFEQSEGAHSEGGLALFDGAFYGTAAQGGANGLGTVFRLDTDGSVTPLWDFAGGDGGENPRAALLLASDGNFYGTTRSTIFRMPPAGTPTTLHTFTGKDGTGPHAALTEAGGFLYGTTEVGGSSGLGTVFRSDFDGNVTTLYEFSLSNGQNPRSELLLASNGVLYGTTPYGGAPNAGLIYRLAPAADPTLASLSPSSGRAAGGTALEISGGHFQPGLTLSLGAVAAAGIVDLDYRAARAVSPSLPPGTLNDLVLTNPDSSTATLPSAWFADFLDVPSTNLFHDSVESIVRAGITSGCGAGNYCPGNSVTRAQMAVFLLKAEHGADYVPPPCVGNFDDVLCPSAYADWIERLAAEGVTSGCGGANYCPGNPVTRAQMAVFLLKTKEGSSYVPPAATGIFGDVPPGSPAADWIEELYGRGITGGCSAAPLLYCPGNANTRGQMAVFLTRTFGL